MRHPSRPIFIVLGSIMLLIACASPQKLLDVQTSTYEQRVGIDQSKTYNAVVALVVAEGYDAAVAEKGAGLLRLERRTLSPAQLDQYCEVPLVYEKSGEAVSTFSTYDAKLLEEAEGRLVGSVAMTFLVTTSGEGSLIKIRSDYEVVGPKRRAACQSKGVLESELFAKIKEQIVAPRR